MKTVLLLVSLGLAPLAEARHRSDKSPGADLQAWQHVIVAQARTAAMADRETLLRVKAEADRPTYPGNAYAKTHDNLWRAIIAGTAKIPVKKT